MVCRISALGRRLISAAAGLSVSLVCATSLAETVNTFAENWVASWGCAPGFAIGQELSDQTLRQFVRLSVGGKQVRIRLSNETGSQPLVIGAAHLAVAGRDKGSIDPSSDRALTFGGTPTITVPSGALVISDPVNLEV